MMSARRFAIWRRVTYPTDDKRDACVSGGENYNL